MQFFVCAKRLLIFAIEVRRVPVRQTARAVVCACSAKMIPYDLKKVKAIALDVDGVLSCNVVSLDASGQPCRTANIKDGYALQLAARHGLQIAIISGGKSKAVEERYAYLGIQHVYMGVSYKIDTFRKWCDEIGVSADEVVYMGDDIPDLPVMEACGCAACPHDAAAEVRAAATYVSPYDGGHGCVRDVLEQIMRAHGTWAASEKAFGW